MSISLGFYIYLVRFCPSAFLNFVEQCENNVLETAYQKKIAHAELQGDHSDAKEITKKVYQALLLAKKRHALYSSRDQWSEDKLEKTLDDIYELCLKYQLLCDLGRGHTIESENIAGL